MCASTNITVVCTRGCSNTNEPLEELVYQKEVFFESKKWPISVKVITDNMGQVLHQLIGTCVNIEDYDLQVVAPKNNL